MTIQILIDIKGILTKFSVKDKKLSDEFKNCVNTIYACPLPKPLQATDTTNNW